MDGAVASGGVLDDEVLDPQDDVRVGWAEMGLSGPGHQPTTARSRTPPEASTSDVSTTGSPPSGYQQR